MSGTDLTILVTTYNRYSELARLLRYASTVDTPYPIRVLDSSSDRPDPGILQQCLAGSQVARRTFDPGTPPMRKLLEGLREVVSPYVVVWADDDFLVPRSLARGVQFLEEHEDFSVVHGPSVLFTMEDRAGRRALACMPYWQRTLIQETASARLRQYLANYCVLNYSIHRTESLRRNVALCVERGFGYEWGELALGSLSAIQGKIGGMDRLYLVKETREGTDAWWTWLRGEGRDRADAFDWVVEPAFAGSYAAFHDCLAEELSRLDGVELPQARHVVKGAVWSYLNKVLVSKWNGRYGPGRQGLGLRAREAARRLPVVRGAWHRVRDLLPRGRGARSLPALLRSRSPYHEDFMPIYRAITAEPAS